MLIVYEKDRVPGRNGKGCLSYQKDIPIRVVAETLARIWFEKPHYHFKATEDKPFSLFISAAHEELLGVTASVILDREAIGLAQPSFKMVKITDRWLVGHWEYDERSLVTQKDEQGWFFCHRPKHQAVYFYFEVMFPFHIDRIERCVNGIVDIYYPPFQKPWPDPISCDPSWYEKTFFALGVCNAMLKPGDTNPLTLLLRSKNPEVRERGKKLALHLEVIQQCLRASDVGSIDIRDAKL